MTNFDMHELAWCRQRPVSAAEKTDLQSLVVHRESVQFHKTMEDVHRAFHDHPHEYVAVLRDSLPIGICSRGTLGFVLGSRYGFALFSKKTIDGYMLKKHLSFKSNTPIREVIQRTLTRTGSDSYDDVLLTAEDGSYLGMIPVQSLVRLQSSLIDEQMKDLERQDLELRERNKDLFRSLSQLRQTRGRYDILFENSAIGVALLNVRGEIQNMNRQLEQLLGGKETSEEICPPDLASLIIAQDRESFLAMLQRHGANSENPLTATDNAEFTLELPEKGQRLFRFITSWIPETGQICACMDDITEQRLIERKMASKEKHQMLESLVGGIAHEINNKLVPIIGFSDLLILMKDKFGHSEKLDQYCQAISQSARESAQIIRQLLQLSKPGAIEPTPCDLRGIVNDALAVLKLAIRDSTASVQIDVPPAAVNVLADPIQLKQVVINLVLNALDATHQAERRELHIQVTSVGEYATLRVKDTGHGIKPEHLKRIFDPFFTTKGPDKGTGLGLSVCFSIIKQHGGSISVESTTDKGTCFAVSLPLPKFLYSVDEPPHDEEDESTDDSSALRILVVDDEEYITNLIQEVLRMKLNCTVETASNATEAIRQMEQAEFDGVIADIRMPGMNGVQFYEWVKSRKPELAEQFFFITGDAETSEASRQVAMLDVPLIRKPFTSEDLLRQCRQMTASCRQS